MYMKRLLGWTALSLGLTSSGSAMKYGSPFQLKVEAFVNQMAFPGMDVQFPAGNQMKEQDVYNLIYNSSKKAYGDALKTGIPDKDIYSLQAFDQFFNPWLDYFPKFVFYQGADLDKYENEDLRILRAAISERNIKEACVMITGDHKNPARNKDIFIKVQVIQYN